MIWNYWHKKHFRNGYFSFFGEKVGLEHQPLDHDLELLAEKNTKNTSETVSSSP
jgi:hypothetical protein